MENNTLSKKELYDREHKKKEPEKRPMSPKVYKYLPILLLSIGIIAVAYVVTAGTRTTQVDGTLAEEVSAADQIRGTGAKVTIVEYSDFQCPACLVYEPFLKSMIAQYGSQIRLVYRHFPLRTIHAQAEMMARGSEAAGIQGKFWEMHDLIFEGQSDWVRGDAKQKMIGYAQGLGLDMNKFVADLESAAVIQKVERDYQSGIKSGVSGTPTLFINGKKIQPSTFQELQGLIERLINEKSTSSLHHPRQYRIA